MIKKGLRLLTLAFAVFVVNLNSSGATFTEGFNSNFKSAYDASPTGVTGGDGVTISSNSWTIFNALAGNAGSDKYNGSYGIRARGNKDTIQMNFDKTSGIGDVAIYYARYGSDAGSSIKLEYSTNGGSSWVGTGQSFSTAGITTLTPFTYSLNQTGNVRVRFICTSTSGNRYNLDDFSLTDYGSCSTPTTQASAITFSSVSSSSMDVSWTNGDGSNRVVYINSTNSFTAPTDGGTLPSANTTWANSGQQLVYNSNGSSVSVTGLSASTTYYFRVYEYNCTGSSSKFITSTATNNPNSQATTTPTSTASVIQAVSGSEATTISSLENGTITNNTQGAQVWQFKLFDGDGSADDGDALPTIYKQWTIRAATGNTVPNWTTVVDNVKFFDGSSSTPISGSFIVGNSTISFTPTSGLSVADGAGSFKQISMRLSIDNPMAAGSDGKRLVFKLENADVTVDNNTVSSQLATFTANSSSSKNEIDVLATLQFIDAPTSVPVGSNFTITVSAIDANGNIDQNQTPAITLAKSSGAGTLTGGATHNLVAGTYTFTGLSYNQLGAFQISASGGGFSAVYATINSTNDPYQLFDDFNRTDNNTVGIPSSGGSTAWTETETGDGSRLRIDNGTLLLSNCNVGGGSGNGVEQAQFNGTGKYATTFTNADGELVWLFNMRSSRLTPSGFSTTNTYGAAVVLGSTQSDFYDPSANGYAVIIGNSGSPDPAKLVYFTGGLRDNTNVTNIVASNYTGETGYLSVKVVFNPCNSQWSLYVRNDGSSFAAPNVGSLGSAFTATNSTYTASSLPYFGALWQHGSSCSETLTIDNLYIPNAAALSGTAKLWTGNIDNDWSKTGNWCKGSVPTSTDDATIPNVTNSPVIGGSAAVKDISLAGGATLTVANGGSLTLNGTFANSGAVTIQDGGNFLQGNSSSYGGSGTFTVEKSITNIANGYRDVSSPVATTVADLADDFTVFGQNGVNCWYSYSPYPNVQVYDEAANNALSTPTGNYFTGWLSRTGNSNTLSPMQGFAIRTYAGAPFTLDFTGTPHNDTLNRAITNTPSASTSQDGWNFVGNPYPSNIDWVTAAALNSSSIDGNYYVFNTTGEYTGNWGTCNASGVASGLNGISATIASGQGFFVKTSAGGTFTLNNTVRTATAANFYKAGVQSNEVRLLLSGQGNSDEIVAYTDANASQNEDKGLDAVKIPAGSTVYMGYVSQGKDYAINVLDEITENTELPLIMRVSENGNYSLTANALNLTDLTAYLKDKTTGTLTNLETRNIVLQLNANENYNNYSIVFAAKVVSGINESAENAVSIYSNKNQVTVLRNKNTPATITIYNTMGQQLTEETTTSRKTTIELNGSQAWYAIVKVKEEGINKVSKVFISNK
ncbi:MAG TPA: T9SS type A sorting domain-containing protein [Chitinophagales bacterium]|nr:T9SS type A sorting domain-containing protein [Chitinophagales bacterium]